MLSKTKKLLFLTSGLAGALAISTVAGVALSSCTIETVNGSGSNNGSSNNVTEPDTWYYKDINWNDAATLNNLIIDDQGFVYSNKYKTEIIAIMPGYDSSTLVIPSSVVSISGYNNVTVANNGQVSKEPAGAFQNLTSITSVKFAGNKITTIGKRAFFGCSSLQSVNLPSSITLVDNEAFRNCSFLNSINLDNIQYIGSNAFNSSMVNVPDGSVNLNLNKVTFIAPSAFENATGIGLVDFSKNTTLTQISEKAFNGCANLSGDIDLSNATKLFAIGNSNLDLSVNINANTNGSSFKGTAITNVYLPSTPGLRSIATESFKDCAKLTTIGPKGSTGFVAIESILGVYNNAFANTQISSVDISKISSKTPLNPGVFSNMSNLSSVNLGTTITTIPAACFANCTSLTSLSLPSSITSISSGNPNYRDATINFNLNVDYPPFYGSGLTSIDFSPITSYQTTNDHTLDLPEAILLNCTKLQNVTLKAGTTSIGKASFAGALSLTSINTQNGTKNSLGYTATSDIKNVDERAFWGTGLSNIDLSAITSSSYSSLKYLTFSSCENLVNIKLPTTITAINNYAVDRVPNLESVNFGDLTLSSIGNGNFSYCKLKEIDLTNSTINTFSTDNQFISLTENTVVKLPPSVWNVPSHEIFSYRKTITNDSGTTTTTVPLPIIFPKGFAPSTGISGFTNGLLTAHTMFGRIKDSLDMSSFTNLRSIGVRTFFDSQVSNLTFSASSFANGRFGDKYSQSVDLYTYLGFLGANKASSTSPEYATTSLPFGNMINLNAINFKNFTNSNTTDTDDILSKTTDDTWIEVTRIINSFSNSLEQESYISRVSNLSEWGDTNNDITVEVKKEDNDEPSKITSIVFEKNDRTPLLTINSDSTNGTFTYENVTWTINIQNGSIIISSSSINSYRAITPSNSNSYPANNSYRAFFNTKSETNDGNTTIIPDSNIIVTLNVVSPSTATPTSISK